MISSSLRSDNIGLAMSRRVYIGQRSRHVHTLPEYEVTQQNGLSEETW